MENTKPQWLIDAENEINIAANTKYGKMTDQYINAGIGGSNSTNRYDSEYQSKMGKLGGKKGAEVSWKTKLEKHEGLEGVKKVMKDQFLKQSEEFKKEFHSKGAQVSGINRSKVAKEQCLRIINNLPDSEWFTIKEIEEACNKEGKLKSYFADVRRYYPNTFETFGRGGNTKYKKVWNQEN